MTIFQESMSNNIPNIKASSPTLINHAWEITDGEIINPIK